MAIPARLNSAREAWITPERVLDGARAVLGSPLPLDPCTEADNPTGAARFFTEADNGLAQVWGAPFWCNPPFSSAAAWIRRCVQEAGKGVPGLLLLPVNNRWEQGYVHAALNSETLTGLVFCLGRVSFLAQETGLFGLDYKPKDSNLYATALLAFNVPDTALRGAFGALGAVVPVHHP